MNDEKRNRIALGQEIQHRRNAAGWTQQELQDRSKVTYSAISAIEAGKRVVGSKVAEALADAFKLQGTEREQFLLRAAGTSRRDRLVGPARELPPEMINYVAQRLQAEKVAPNDIQECRLTREVLGLHGKKPLVDIQSQFQKGLEDYFQAFNGRQSQAPLLELSLHDGKQVFGIFLVANTTAT